MDKEAPVLLQVVDYDGQEERQMGLELMPLILDKADMVAVVGGAEIMELQAEEEDTLAEEGVMVMMVILGEQAEAADLITQDRPNQIPQAPISDTAKMDT
jgi:hypothetical protein